MFEKLTMLLTVKLTLEIVTFVYLPSIVCNNKVYFSVAAIVTEQYNI